MILDQAQDALGGRVNPDSNYVIIVPDQYSMQTQKEIVSESPQKGILNIDVLSFGRLTHKIFEETGVSHRAVLDDMGKTLLLRRVAGKCEPELKIRKEDLVLENVDTYRGSDNDSDSFYVNTDYNIHRDDGASSSEEYHFTKSEEQAAEEPLPDEAVPPAAPMRPNDDVSFYSGGLNEEGNFYVEGSEGDDSENPENKRWRY